MSEWGNGIWKLNMEIKYGNVAYSLSLVNRQIRL